MSAWAAHIDESDDPACSPEFDDTDPALTTASTLMIPVESQVRELDAKLLLACVAAERGYPVILGSRAFLHFRLASIPRGVYLAKSMRSLSERVFALLQKLGHEIVAFEEEGLVRLPDEEYYRRRLSTRAMTRVSHLLAWGADDARVLKDFPGYSGTPVHVTGNPRIDLMRPEMRAYYDDAANALRARFGDFVLINTNFGGLNHFFGNLSDMKRLVEGGELKGESEFFRARAGFRTAIFAHFREMLPQLAEALPNLRFVLRPHPSESHEVWHLIAARFNNVDVVNEGAVTPWLIAAQAMIANGCTTSVEASVLGTPGISYQPLTDELYEERLPQEVSHRCFDIDGLVDLVRAATSGSLGVRDDETARSRLAQHLSALEGRLAADRMVDVLDQAGYRDRPPPASSPRDWLEGWGHTQLRTLVKKVNMRRPGHRNSLAYHAHRFPEIDARELERRVGRLQRITGRFADVEIESRSRHMFAVKRRGAAGLS